MYCYQPPITSPEGWRAFDKFDNMGAQLFRVITDDTDWAARKEQWEEQKREREANLREEKTRLFENSLTAQQRDPLFRKLASDMGLSETHRKMLKARGLTDEHIDAHPFFSIVKFDTDQSKIINKLPKGFPGLRISKKGYKYLTNYNAIAIPTIDTQGMMTGWQFTPEVRGEKNYKGEEIPKYTWGLDQSLPVGDGEMPIQVFNAQKNQVDQSTILATEGTLKPLLAAHLHQISVVGASGGNFAASPIQFAEAVSEYDRVVIAIDAGDAVNPQRVTHWKRQAEFLATLGIEVKWAWWGQETKDANDIDEMTVAEYKSIKLLDTEELLDTIDKIAAKHKNLERYKDLSTLKSVPTLSYTDEWVRVPKFKAGSIALISSGVGTGKTEALSKLVAEHRKTHPTAKIIILSHRIQLAKALAARLNAEYIADLKHGIENYASINAADLIALCVDSLHNLDLRDIPSHSIIVLDEIEAILSHLTQGGTLGDRTPFIQSRFVELLRGILANNGQIIGAEDSITEITIDTLKYICPSIKPDILVNTRHKFDYTVKLGGHTNKRDFTGAILDRLAQGERIIIPTTSQAFGHQLHELLLIAFSTLEVVRIDSRTTTEYGDFMLDPAAWLKANHTDVLIYSPAIESGVSIVDAIGDRPFFDSMFMYVANLSIRSQIQLLHRYRGNCPRFIFSPNRLATSLNSFRPEVNFRLARQTAIEEHLRHGHTIKDTEIGGIFNCVDAKLKARDALSAAYNRNILVADLESRDHDVSVVKWGDERTEYQAEHLGKYWLTEAIGIGLIDARDRIIEQDATAMARANCIDLTVSQAQTIVADPNTPFDGKWAAKKRIDQDLLPGAPLEDVEFCKFLLGKARKKINARAYMLNPLLAHVTSGIKIERQQTQSHVLHYRTPIDEPLALLLQPIKDYIIELVNCPGYTSEHPAAIAIAEYCVANSFQFYRLKRIQFKAPKQDRLGNTHHTPAASANKIIRMLGWDAAVISKVSGDRVYRISNAVDPIADVYIECRMRKLVELQSKHKDAINRRVVKDVSQSIDNDVHGCYDVGTEEVGEDPLSKIKLMAKQLRTLNGTEYDNYEAEVLDYARNNNLEFIKPEGRVGIGFGKWQIAA